MSKPIRRRAPTPDDAQQELVRRITAQAEARTLRRVRDYLGRGRPLASLPLLSLRAQWIDASVAIVLREDRSRAKEFDDLETEFDLRGLETPIHRVLPELTRFARHLRKAKRNPDPAALDRFNDELDALCDRLMAEDRAAID
ncbi:MAG: hypothetical protein JSS04_06780 [Proteobacteria bacterium]|nr:hypothetical protein [Pseudomonadota bacterium]